MSRGVAYRADMLDEPSMDDDDSAAGELAETAVDAGDHMETYRRRPSEAALQPAPAPRRTPKTSIESGDVEAREAKLSGLRPGLPKSLNLEAAPRRKGRNQQTDSVELRNVRRTSSTKLPSSEGGVERSKRRPSSAGKAERNTKRPSSAGNAVERVKLADKRPSSAGNAERSERKRQGTKVKRRRSMERNDSATRLLDAVVLDDDYYQDTTDNDVTDGGIPFGELEQPQLRGQRQWLDPSPNRRPPSMQSAAGDLHGPRKVPPDESLQAPVISEKDLEGLLSALEEKEELVASLQEKLHAMIAEEEKRKSVKSESSAEAEGSMRPKSAASTRALSLSAPVKYEKPSQTSSLLLRMVQSAHSPLSHCSLSRQASVVECMHLTELAAGSTLDGAFSDLLTAWRLCAVEKGELELRRGETAEIIRRGSVLVLPTPSDTWCTCRTPVQLWSVDAITLNELQRCDAELRSHENLSLLRTVPEFQSVVNTNMKTFLQSLDERVYDNGDDLQLKGAEAGDNLVHIVKIGQVRKSDRSSRTTTTFGRSDVIIPTIETVNTCRVRAEGEVVCVVVEWAIWQQAMLDPASNPLAVPGSPTSLSPPHRPFGFGTGVSARQRQERPSQVTKDPAQSIRYDVRLGVDVMQLCLGDLRVVGTLGAGAFGRIELVCIQDQPTHTFALKRLSRQHLIQEHQEDQALREREVLSMIRRDGCHARIIQMSRTFRDHMNVYFLLEPQLGGDLFSLCRRQGPLKDKQAPFYVACIIEALDYLHGLNIIYRGLKPEDVLLDSNGYAKLCDFGHSKILEEGAMHTYSFCGTAEYMTPEQVLEETHGMPVDVWGLGVITYELLCGRTPFSRDDPQHVYAAILKGINEVGFPSYIKGKAGKFIRSLCSFEPHMRAGCDQFPTDFQAIRSLPWLKAFRWDLLQRQTLSPPFRPTLYGPHDTRYFDSVCPEAEPGVAGNVQLPSGGWDAAF